MAHLFFSARLSMLLVLALAGCGTDPPLSFVLGETWDEAPLTRDGVQHWRSYVMESDEVTVTQHCGTTEVEVRVPVRHRYDITFLESMSKSTNAQGLSCTFMVNEAMFSVELAPDGQNLFAIGDALNPMMPYGQVNGVFGPRSFRDSDDDSTINFFVTPTFIDGSADCDNGITASMTFPIEIAHYFVVEEGAEAGDADCTVELGAGVYRYYPEGEELLLEREGGSRLVLTRRVPEPSEG